MVTECECWTVNTDRFRADLVTPAAVVLWRVLIASDRSLVADALARVVAEISTRKSVSLDDAVQAPGEQARNLDGDGSAEAASDHASNG